MESSHPLADDINNRIVFWSMWVCYMYRVEELAYQQSDLTTSVLMRQTTLFLRVFYTNFVPLQYLN